MPQTMLALLALIIATLFAVQQQRQALHAQAKVVRNSLALHATGVVEDVLGGVGAVAFDEATTGNNEADAAGELTAPGYLGSEGGQPNDIDDFHAMVGIEDYRIIQRKDPDAGLVTDTLWFDVAIEVSYADAEGHPMTTQTKYKKATAYVYSLDIPYPDTVKLSRLYACGSKCTW